MSVVTSDANTILVSSDDVTTEIAPGVTDWSDTPTSAFHDFGGSGAIVINYGGILNGGGGDGVLFDFFASGTTINEIGGSIAGTDGVVFDGVGSPTSFTNFGTVTATGSGGFIFNAHAGVVFADFTGGALLDNRGQIYSLGAGVYDNATGGGNTIDNSGVIEGNVGVQMNTAVGKVTFIDNSGTISGHYAILGGLGTLNLTNSGTLSGSVAAIALAGSADNDTFSNTGNIIGAVRLGPGNDRFDGTGGTSADVFGQDGNDHLIGSTHADELSGGPGNDTLTGSLGPDQFVFDAALNASTNVDHVTDFHHGLDKIDLSHAIFAAAGPLGTLHAAAFFAGAAAHDASDRVIYNPASGFVSYDADGSGHAHAPTYFAKLAPHLALTHADFLVVA